MGLNTTQKKLSAAFEEISTEVSALLALYDVEPEIADDIGETLLSIYSKHLACGRPARRSRT